jgi:hypothetical protein
MNKSYNNEYIKYKKRYMQLKVRHMAGGFFNTIDKINAQYPYYKATLAAPYFSYNMPNKSYNFKADGSLSTLDSSHTAHIAESEYFKIGALRSSLISIIKKLPINSYILCVGYCKCDTDPSCKQGGLFSEFMDFQIGISGKAKMGELQLNAAIREVCEESNLLVTPNDLKHVKVLNIGARQWFLGAANVSNMTQCKFVQPEQENKDNYSQRIIVIPYMQVQPPNIYPNIYNPVRSIEEKNICQILFLGREEVLSFLKKIEDLDLATSR